MFGKKGDGEKYGCIFEDRAKRTAPAQK